MTQFDAVKFETTLKEKALIFWKKQDARAYINILNLERCRLAVIRKFYIKLNLLIELDRFREIYNINDLDKYYCNNDVVKIKINDRRLPDLLDNLCNYFGYKYSDAVVDMRTFDYYKEIVNRVGEEYYNSDGKLKMLIALKDYCNMFVEFKSALNRMAYLFDEYKKISIEKANKGKNNE